MTSAVSVDQFVRREWTSNCEIIARKIHYACGSNVRPGWLNVDLFDGSFLWAYRETGLPADLVNQVFNLDLLQPHPFPADSFTHAYCEDFIEHISQKDTIIFLAEVYRTLAPGGLVRISTPSLEGVLGAHFERVGFAAVREEAPNAYDNWGHIHFLSHDSLRKITRALGFVDYQPKECLVSSVPELSGLECRPDQAYLNMYAEFRKSA